MSMLYARVVAGSLQWLAAAQNDPMLVTAATMPARMKQTESVPLLFSALSVDL